MGPRMGKALVVLSWTWVAAVAAYMAWGKVNQVGLYAWLANLQTADGGSYNSALTTILPGVVLMAPALWYLRRAERAAVARDGPNAELGRLRRGARGSAYAGLAAAALAAGAWLLSLTVPDGSEPAVPVDAAALGAGPVPAGRVTIRGEDSGVRTEVTATSRYTDRNTVYVGFRPEEDRDGGSEAPLRLFVERYFGDSADAATAQYFLPEQTGYLVENGVPAAALADLRARGIGVATPHYVLRTAREGRREPYYIVAGLAALVAAACLAVALIGSLEARSKARRG